MKVPRIYIFCNIIYLFLLIKYASIMQKLIKVYDIILNKKLMSYAIFSHFVSYNISICTRIMTNTFVRYT